MCVAALAPSGAILFARDGDTDAICTREKASQFLRFFHQMTELCAKYRETSLKSEEYSPVADKANPFRSSLRGFFGGSKSLPFYDIFEPDEENKANWRPPPVGTRPSCAWIILMITGEMFTPEERYNRYPFDFTADGHVREDRLPCGRTPVILMNGLPHIASYNGYYLLTGGAKFPWLIDNACHSDYNHYEIVLGQAILGPRGSNEIVHLDIRVDEQARREIIVSNVHDLALRIDEQDIILASPMSCKGWRTRLTPKSDANPINGWQLHIAKDREAEVSEPYEDILSSELLPNALNFQYPRDMEVDASTRYGYCRWHIEPRWGSCHPPLQSSPISEATKRPGHSMVGPAPKRAKKVASVPSAEAGDSRSWTSRKRYGDPLAEPPTKRRVIAPCICLPQANEPSPWKPKYPHRRSDGTEIPLEELSKENMDEAKVFANAKSLLMHTLADANWLLGVHQSCADPKVAAAIANYSKYDDILRRHNESIDQATAMAEALSEGYKSDLMKHVQAVLDLIGATFHDIDQSSDRPIEQEDDEDME